MERFVQALAALLPTGFAWPRDAGSVWMRVLRALAGSFASLHDDVAEVVRQWQPHHAVARLAEWEEATGLPDTCFALPPRLLAPGLYDYGPGDLAAFSRASVGTYFDAAGVLQTAGVDVPRFTYNPATLALEGLLIETAATNKLLRSSEFDLVWVKSGDITLTTNAKVALDGTASADLMTPRVGSGVSTSRAVQQSIPATDQGYWTFSLYVCRQAGVGDPVAWPRVAIRLYDSAVGTNGATCSVNMTTLVPAAPSINGGNWTAPVARLEYVDDDWYRLSITVNVTTAITQLYTAFWLGGYNGSDETAPPMYIWGAQLENAAGPSSHIPTGAAQVTRAADLAYLPPSDAEQQALRRKLLLARLRGPVLKYDDSSPASPGAIVAICAWLGYQAEVRYNTPFRCGHQVGQPLGALDGKLYIIVTLQSRRFRVGMSRVGSRLLEGDLNGGELACYLQRVVPARYSINVIFV